MRKKRSFKVNRCYHLISRIAHRAYFFDEGEKDRFVNLIRRVEQFCGVLVLGYAVMSNHFHIYVYLEDEHPVSEEELYAKICRLYCKDTLAAIIDKWERLKELAAQADVSIRHAGLTEFDDYKRSFVARMFNITSFMKTLKEHYTLSYNARHKHCGTLWEGRYRSRESKPVSSDMSPILAYIDCNPAEADICRDPAKYKWCSFAAACEGDELARRAYRFAYGNDEDPWKTIAELHRAAIRKRLGEIGEERRTGNVVSVIAALFSKREEEYAAAVPYHSCLTLPSTRSDQKPPPKTRAQTINNNQGMQESESRMRTTRRKRGLQMPGVSIRPMKAINGQPRMIRVSAAIFKNVGE